MLWKIWATVGAVVCGVAVATLPGGAASPWAYVILLAALVSGAALTAIALLVRYAHERKWESSEILPMEPVFRPSQRQSDQDREVVQQLADTVRERDLEWLRGETFTGPWRDEYVSSLREIARDDAGQRGIFEPSLVEVVARLTDAARAFVSVYDEGTSSDPIVRESVWRTVDSVDPMGTITALQENAAKVVEAYESLSTVSKRTFATAAPSRQQGRGR